MRVTRVPGVVCTECEREDTVGYHLDFYDDDVWLCERCTIKLYNMLFKEIPYTNYAIRSLDKERWAEEKWQHLLGL